MKTSNRTFARWCTIAVVFAVIHCSHGPDTLPSPENFKNPPTAVKVHAWWHWLDGNITKKGITDDLVAMKARGIAQATILNVGLFGDRDFGVVKVPFGSERWYEMFRWALDEADRIGIRIGAHNCDGWSSTGGPWITPETSMKQFVWTKSLVQGGRTGNLRLDKPYAVRGFYRDVAVVAFKTGEILNAFRRAVPKVTLNDTTDASVLRDGDPVSGLPMRTNDRILVSFKTSLRFNRIAIHPRRSFMWSNPDDFACAFTAWASQDGVQFRKIGEIETRGLNRTVVVAVPQTAARFVRLTVGAMSAVDAWIPVLLSELELLNGDEKPAYSPYIPHLLEKTASVKSASEDYFYPPADGQAGGAYPRAGEVVVLTDRMNPDGTLRWDAPQGDWTVLRFGYTATGAVNGPATREGEGLECDKMDTAAVNLHFRNFPQKLINHAGPHAGQVFKFLLIDSWECAFQNWTDRFAAEFEKRRGYSLIPYLPVLCGDVIGSAEESEAVLFDFRKTIADLIEQNYYEHFSALCGKAGLEMHAEVIYGGANYPPLDILKTTKCVDLPMTEFWTGTDSNSLIRFSPTAAPESNLPACACAGYGIPVLGSEAYTGMAHYSESLRDLKPFGDRAFCSGINQMILHSNVLQPTDSKPGMTLGQFGSHFNRNNPAWSRVSEWMDYQSRIQLLLRVGAPAPDVLVYLGDQVPQFFTQNASNTPLFGYLVNACNFDLLKNRTRIVDGKIRLNGASDYALIALPERPFMDFETLKRIETLVNAGAVVHGPRPMSMYSKTDLETRGSSFREMADRIWGRIDGKTVVENTQGKGRVFWGIPVAEALKKMDLAPDFSAGPTGAEEFHFTHRKADGIDVYFVANKQNKSLLRECLFRSGGKTPEIWDPETGFVERPAVFRVEDGMVRLPLRFNPYQALLFVFRPGLPDRFITVVEKDGNRIFPAAEGGSCPVPRILFTTGGYFVFPSVAGDYAFMTVRAETLSGRFSAPEEMVIKRFEGTVRFEPAYAASIPPVRIRDLKSLTDFENQDIRYFAGDAEYSIHFSLPDGFASEMDSVLLDIGDFEAVCDVTFNGKKLGGVWNPGTELDVTGLVRPENTLEVTVSTTFRNRFIGDFILYGGVRNAWTSSPIGDFLNRKSALKPCGLMGPLKLVNVTGQRIGPAGKND